MAVLPGLSDSHHRSLCRAKTVRQAAFIDALGAENLPWVYLAVAAVSLPVLIVYSRAVARVRLPMLILAATLLHVLGLVLFFYLFGLGHKWVAALYYVWLCLADYWPLR